MTYKERYGTVENKIKEESQNWLERIKKEGYLYYSEAACKHINLLTKPECDMNEMELDAKREALANSSEIKVGRLELNEAMKALRTIIALENVLNNK